MRDGVHRGDLDLGEVVRIVPRGRSLEGQAPAEPILGMRSVDNTTATTTVARRETR